MTSTGATKPIRKDVARNRARLLAAAREVFAEQGLEATLDDVAKAAGVGTGTAYRHFANKQELAAEILSEASEQLVTDAQDALLIDDPWEALKTFFETSVERMSHNRGLHETLIQQRGPAQSAPLREALVVAVTELFDRAQRAGSIRSDASPTDAAPIFAMMGVAYAMSPPSAPELWRRYLALWLDGLRATGLPPLAEPPLSIADVPAALAAGKRHGRGAP